MKQHCKHCSNEFHSTVVYGYCTDVCQLRAQIANLTAERDQLKRVVDVLCAGIAEADCTGRQPEHYLEWAVSRAKEASSCKA